MITDKLQCPWCGKELSGWREEHLGEFWACCNHECTAFGKFKGNFSMWQLLISCKPAQDVVILAPTTIESLHGWLTKYQEMLKALRFKVSEYRAQLWTDKNLTSDITALDQMLGDIHWDLIHATTEEGAQ